MDESKARLRSPPKLMAIEEGNAHPDRGGTANASRRLGAQGLLLGLLLLTATALSCKPRWMLESDGGKYYAWLRSAAFDHDWDFSNERMSVSGGVERTATGRAVNKWSIGPALLWLPFFAPVYVMDRCGVLKLRPAGGITPLRVRALPGYAVPYMTTLSVGTAFYGAACVLLIVSLAKQFHGRDAAWLAGLALLTATPLPYWTYVRPSCSHALSAFAVALLLTTTHWSRQMPFIRRAALLGAVTGLAALVRWQDAVFALAPLGMLLAQWRAGDRAGNTEGPWLNAKAQRRKGAEKGEEKAGNGESARAKDERQASSRGGPGLNAEAQRAKGAEKGEVRTENGGWRLPTAMLAFGAFSGAALIVFFPQMLGWHSVYGSWLVVPQGREFFDFAPARLVWSLFSPHSGQLVWHPILIVGCVGLVLLVRRQDDLGRLMRWALVAAALAVVVDGGLINEDEWFLGGRFGRRRLTCLSPLFALGLAAFFHGFWSRRAGVVMSAGVLLAAANNGALFLGTELQGKPSGLAGALGACKWQTSGIPDQIAKKLLTVPGLTWAKPIAEDCPVAFCTVGAMLAGAALLTFTLAFAGRLERRPSSSVSLGNADHGSLSRCAGEERDDL